ncbi:NADP-dependent oxidoreductase [Gordonia sp. N1V]|uniref:quinone oxidoreductase family protein n=1 Tax=Gordonia sp. N1V TaxID=3034163 RepID=UPI0023E1A8D2|nr:NADP-dependent oxidoreductase [Gordonia sp. N1V]MDF3285157.1 NADP-dependent oxidoreductase [Gordonia sp. N1V]
MTPARRWVALCPGGLDDFALTDVDVPAPTRGEVTIEVTAAGVNPADLKHALAATEFPLPIGYEVAGRIVALGPDTEIGSGDAAVGDEVLAFRVRGGYATALTAPAEKVFARPETLGVDEAAGLLLAGTTAADMLRAASTARDELIVLHGASGAVGVAVLQLARLRGIRIIGTVGPRSCEHVRDFGGLPVTYGPGVLDRIRAAADSRPIAAALDAVGTDEAVDASLELVADRSRIVTIAAPRRAAADGFQALGGRQPESAEFRDTVRTNLIRLASDGDLVVPIGAVFGFEQAREALRLVSDGHAGGKVVLRTDR